MTDCNNERQHDNKSMCIRVWLEVGHACEPRPRSSSHSLALDWRVWVRGLPGADISTFVHKVVFYLNPPTSFVYPKRVIQEPPYEIQESGCASIDIPIHVYLKHTTKPKMIKLRYSLHIENVEKNTSESSRIYYDFENPTDIFHKCLIKGGGEVVPRTGCFNGNNNSVLVIVPDKESRIYSHAKKEKLFECSHLKKKKNGMLEECPKGCVPRINLKRLLKTAKMSKSEIDIVSHLYSSYKSYEKSMEALKLPPSSDPIYKVPELPVTLKRLLTTGQLVSRKP